MTREISRRGATWTLIAAVLTAILLPMPLVGQVCDWDATATGGDLYRVMHADTLVSEHTQLYQALERATRIETEAPADSTEVVHDSRIRVECPIPEDTTAAPDTTVDDGHGTPEDTTTAPSDTTTDDTSEPEPGDVEPAVAFDPDEYTSAEGLLTIPDAQGVFDCRGNEEARRGDGTGGFIRLDTDVGYPGGEQSMRYDYVDQGINRALHVGKCARLPSGTREVWVEFYARWSPNFFAIEDFPSDGSTFAHKFLFIGAIAPGEPNNWTTSDGESVGRWSLLWPKGGSPNPPNAPIGVTAPRRADGSGGIADPFGAVQGSDVADYFDGEWHRIRLHLRSDPGRYWLEVDGKELIEVTGFTIHPEVVMSTILPGRNKDDGITSGTESLWWGPITVWTEDPGW